MTAAVDQNVSKPWDAQQLPFNFWYRKRLKGDFSTVINTINLTREIIKNGESKGDMYQTFLANLQEAQVRLTQLLFELEEEDMELALKINDSICGTLEWAKKSEVSSLLPSLPDTSDVTKLVENMLERKDNIIKSTDEKKVADLIVIEIQVGVGASAVKRQMSVPRGSTLADLKNSIPNLKKREQVTFVREGLKVEHTTVLINGDNIIAVVTSTEGPFEGFDDVEEKAISSQIIPDVDEKAIPSQIVPIAPPPTQDKNPPKPDIEIDLLTSALPGRGKTTEPLDIFDEAGSKPFGNIFNDQNSNPNEIIFDDDLSSKPVDIANVDISIKAEVQEESNKNPFDPILEPPKQAANANSIEVGEDNEEEPLISFERFSVGEQNAAKEAKEETEEPNEKDNLLGASIPAPGEAELTKEDSFPKFAGFS